MAVRKPETFPPVTIGHIRGHGCRDLLVYCASGRCHHSATMDADHLRDDMPVRSLCGGVGRAATISIKLAELYRAHERDAEAELLLKRALEQAREKGHDRVAEIADRADITDQLGKPYHYPHLKPTLHGP